MLFLLGLAAAEAGLMFVHGLAALPLVGLVLTLVCAGLTYWRELKIEEQIRNL